MIFISHATPQDNEFTLWLALRLAREGYPVWCDLTKLLGGEDFWSDIQAAIKEHSDKFVFVFSQDAIGKQGTLKELSVADSVAKRVKDFIIPIRIDHTPFDDMPIEIHRLNAIDFTSNWKPGLDKLLLKLEEDNIPKNPAFSPNAVADWWRSEQQTNRELRGQPEIYYSNWFSINHLPEMLYCSSLSKKPDFKKGPLRRDAEFPATMHTKKLFSFCDGSELAPFLRGSLSVKRTESTSVDEFLSMKSHVVETPKRERQNLVLNLMRLAWEKFLDSKGLKRHGLSGDYPVHFFPSGLTKNNRVSVPAIRERKVSVAVSGKRKESYWHFALSAHPQLLPEPHFVVFSHVLFSDDGATIWNSAARLHSARRSFCRSWWNKDWLNRLLGSMSYLDSGQGIRIPVGQTGYIELNTLPDTFESPESYIDPNQPSMSIDGDTNGNKEAEHEILDGDEQEDE